MVEVDVAHVHADAPATHERLVLDDRGVDLEGVGHLLVTLVRVAEVELCGERQAEVLRVVHAGVLPNAVDLPLALARLPRGLHGADPVLVVLRA